MFDGLSVKQIKQLGETGCLKLEIYRGLDIKSMEIKEFIKKLTERSEGRVSRFYFESGNKDQTPYEHMFDIIEDIERLCCEYSSIDVVVVIKNKSPLITNAGYPHKKFKYGFIPLIEWCDKNKTLFAMLGNMAFIQHPSIPNIKFLDRKIPKFMEGLEKYDRMLRNYYVNGNA